MYDLRARLVQSIAAPIAPTPEGARGRFNNIDWSDLAKATGLRQR